jgi:IS1 family transposase
MFCGVIPYNPLACLVVNRQPAESWIRLSPDPRPRFWLWACIDADTKLVLSHRIGKRDWSTGYRFVGDVRKRVSGPVQIATDNLPSYAGHIRMHFGYEGYSYGTETKIFGEPMLPDGTLARLGRNEGVRKMQTAERRRW